MQTTQTRTVQHLASADSPALRPLLTFAAVAVPSGWLLLGIPVALGLLVEPFVLVALFVALVAPAVLLTRREPESSVRALLRDTVRLPRHGLLLLPALVLVPALTWTAASLTGNAPTLDRALLAGALVNVVSSVLIVNLWEEMAWQGFVQRRTTARWGFLRGALVTTAMFVAIHLALAFADADGAADVGLGLVALVVAGIGLRLLLGAVDLWSGRSLLTVAIVHASFNAAADFVDSDADWIRYAVVLLLGLGALAIVAARNDRSGRAR
jgi:membrane protease YdiL (CAAX protease family)